jgi:MOSC domain-containing protein YiiM
MGIDALYIAQEAGAPMTALTQARFVVGQGIEGDRYRGGTGSFSASHRKKGAVDHVTIYSWHDLQVINQAMGGDVGHLLRRNIVAGFPVRAFITAGLARITTHDGYVILQWVNGCPPCTRPGTLGGVDPITLQNLMFDHGFGGERAGVLEVVGSGIVRVNDPIEIVEDNLPSYALRAKRRS